MLSFATALAVILPTLGSQAYPTTTPVGSAPADDLAATWDVIVIGSGPAGIIVADRMSEAGKRTILLEQGGPSYYITGGRDRPEWLENTSLSRVDVPGLYSSIFAKPGDLVCTAKQLGAYGGCTIGGASAINAGLFFEPPASDFDDYFPEQWKSADMASAIGKVRARQPFTDNPSADGKYYLDSIHDAAQQWIVDGAGYNVTDMNAQPSEKTNSFGRTQFAYDGGQRSAPVKSYLQTALARSNFRLLSGVEVKRVVRSGGIASGVVVAFNGTERTLELGNDGGNIILSAGALGSPRLLMKSGIGEGGALADLSAAGLLDMPSGEWINNTAVGDKLFDNPNTFIELSGDAVDSFTYKYSDPAVQDEDLYLQSRSGPYASAGQTDVVFDKITLANGETYGVQGTFGSAGYQDFTSNHTITMNVYGTSGMGSTGRVLLDDQGVPRPSSFLYSDPRDADAIATFIRKLFDALPQSTLTPQNIAPNATHEELVRYITTPSSYATGYVNHFAGSCRLGACVDLDARVKGVQNLFVVDASITAPFSVNPMFGIMAAAERASELILNGYEKV